MTEVDLLKMPLHTHRKIDNNLTVYRVLGGWLYESYIATGVGGYCISTTFVPQPAYTGATTHGT